MNCFWKFRKAFILFLCQIVAVSTCSFLPGWLLPTTTRKKSSDDRIQPRLAAFIDRSNYGDARGAALLIDNVSVLLGGSPILTDISWRIEPRAKWGLVGANGSGKTTLLQAILGKIGYTGKITIGNTQQVGYLPQTAVAGSTRTVYDEACIGLSEIVNAQSVMEQSLETSDWKSFSKAQERFEALGGYQMEPKVAEVLRGLGFTDFSVTCDQLSFGWQMRVALARQLLSEPTLNLLDEPSNHLDAAAKKWLADYLKTYDFGAMILVTHDIELLESMDHIAEVIPGSIGLQIYKSCTYSQYLNLKQQRMAAAQAEIERQQAKIDKLQDFVDRFGAKATKASAAQSRVKQIQKLEQQKQQSDISIVPTSRFQPHLQLPVPSSSVGTNLLRLVSADIGYNTQSPIVKNVNLSITKGMKLLIRGPNGSGKSTILHSIRGTLPVLAGERIENPDLRLGMFTQDLAQELDANARAVDIVTSYARDGYGDISVSNEDARTVMGGLGLRGDKSLRQIGDLSGGEKARVALAMFALKPSNVYLLDEPSNHLDKECVEALSNALSEWGGENGALVVVSHDRTFCEKIEFTHVATVQDGSFTIEPRDSRPSDWIIDDLSSGFNRNCGSYVFGDEKMMTSSQQKRIEEAKQRKLAFNAPKRIAKLESMIEQTEAKISEIEEKMLANGRDVGLLVDLSKEKEDLEAKLELFMEEWSELEEILAKSA